MTYDSLETSRYSGTPFELYWFVMGTKSWRMTSGDKQRSYGGGLFLPDSISSTEINQNQELRSGSITVVIPRNHEIASLFVGYAPPAPMSLVIYRGHEGEGDDQVVTYFTGRVATGTFREHCELMCVPEQDSLKRSVPIQKFQSQCNWVLFGPGCGKNKADYAVTGTVSAISGDQVTIPEIDALADGYFRAGWIEKGDSRRMILSHAGAVATLITPMIGLQVGDTVVAYPGCMLDAGTCKNKFNNLANFWGFARIPTRNPFNGVE